MVFTISPMILLGDLALGGHHQGWFSPESARQDETALQNLLVLVYA